MRACIASISSVHSYPTVQQKAYVRASLRHAFAGSSPDIERHLNLRLNKDDKQSGLLASTSVPLIATLTGKAGILRSIGRSVD